MFKVYVWNLQILAKVSKKLLAANFISSMIDGISTIVYAILISRLVDNVINITNSKAKISELTPLIIIIFCYYVFTGLARIIMNYSESYFRQQLNTIPNLILFEKLNELGVEQTEKPEIQNKINRYRDNMNLFYNQFINITALILNISAILSAGAVLLTNLPIIVPLIFILLLPKILTNSYYLKKVWKLDKESTPLHRMTGSISNFMADPATFKEIFLSGSGDFFSKKYLGLKESYLIKLFGIRGRWFAYLGIFRILDAAIITTGLVMTLNLVINNQISIGQLTLLLSSIVYLRGTLDSMVFTITNLSESGQRLKDSKELFDLKPIQKNGVVKLDKLPPVIEFKNVSFKYSSSNNFVIKNLNLRLKAGEKVAIVGHNGAGKTTLIKLLTRIYKPTNGQILINGIDLNDLDKNDWYKNVGVLFQDYNTYGFLDVQDNVFIGDINSKKNVKAIKEALKTSDAFDFINKYPAKLNTILSEKYDGGIRPSTGQWQKIAIARFFYRNSQVLILDEPTASIDAVSEASIFDNIYEFIKNKSVIIVSHRFSTVRKADRIIVLNEGEIVESGTHSELLKLGKYYANAFNLQAKGYENQI